MKRQEEKQRQREELAADRAVQQAFRKRARQETAEQQRQAAAHQLQLFREAALRVRAQDAPFPAAATDFQNVGCVGENAAGSRRDGGDEGERRDDQRSGG